MAALVVVGLAAACASAPAPRLRLGSPPAPRDPSGAPSPALSPPVTPSVLPVVFRGTISPLPPSLAAEMRGTTWRPGCPVPLSDLRLLSLRYWGFDGVVHDGPMVVNVRVSKEVVSVFRRLFEARFPIHEIHLAIEYRGQDDPNDRRDYTDAFNCRPVVTARGPLSTWSQHAYGWAVDINPVENPYVAADGYVRNSHARPYRDRGLERPGMIHPGDAVVRAFDAISWTWGGSWDSAKDYMHFSLTGK